MKINKLMLALAVAASAFAACNKQETTPVENQLGNRSILLNIENLLPTKSPDTALDAGQVALKNFQVFFSDGTNLYEPKTVTALDFTEEEGWGTYFAETNETQKQFHFLDKSVSRVIVIGNLGEAVNVKEVNTEAKLNEVIKRLTLESQLDETNLTLYGWDNTLVESNLTFNPDEHVDQEDQHPTPIMMAEVNLYPTVARFEVNSFEYGAATTVTNEDGTTTEVREYTDMTINNVSMINYYTEADITLPTGAANGGPAAIPTITVDETKKDAYFGGQWDENDIYQEYFTKFAEDYTAWNFDQVGQTLTTGAYQWDVQVEDNNCYAYHTFPTLVPTFNVQLTAVEQGITSLLYLQTKKLMDGETEITSIEPGKIYKMDFYFDDTVLQDAEKCIDVKITVHDWVVVNVTPEF